jgi:hypothetical protein
MMNIMLILMLVALAWVHARLTVVAAIHQTESPEHMLQRMIRGTWWQMILVSLCYYTLGDLGAWILLYALARCLFLLTTNWPAVCKNYFEIKRLIAGS